MRQERQEGVSKTSNIKGGVPSLSLSSKQKARDEPSDDRDAPDSLKSSPPIWIGKTRSRGRICGILWTSPPCSGSEGGAALGASLGLAESMAASAGEAADMDEAETDMLLRLYTSNALRPFADLLSLCWLVSRCSSQAAIAGGNCGWEDAGSPSSWGFPGLDLGKEK